MSAHPPPEQPQEVESSTLNTPSVPNAQARGIEIEPMSSNSSDTSDVALSSEPTTGLATHSLTAEPSSIPDVLRSLDRIQYLDERRWVAACPDHKDEPTSLEITQDDRGDITILCKHGCRLDWEVLGLPRDRTIENLDGSLDVYAPRPPRDRPDAAGKTSTRKKDRDSDIELLRGLLSDAQCFHSQYGEAYIAVGRDNYPIRGEDFEDYLMDRFYHAYGRTPPVETFRAAIKTLSAKAKFAGEQREIYVRVANLGDSLYIDLADSERQVIRITENGWNVDSESPVSFRRPRGMRPLPVPIRGGSVSELWESVHLGSEDNRILVTAWVVGALAGIHPCPILDVFGEQGSGKTMTTRRLRSLIDPAVAYIRPLPRDERDLSLSANNALVLAYDNVSSLSEWLADALCRLATGTGFGTRRLYSDQDEVLFEGHRPIIVNGIEPLSKRPDLQDRAILIEIPRLSGRRTEREIDQEFDQACARILGAILDAIVVGLRNIGHTRLESPTRMADFETFIVAAESALPWKTGQFLEAYRSNRRQAMESSIEDEPIMHALEKYFELEGVGESSSCSQKLRGTAAEILEVLAMAAGESGMKSSDWPRSASQFSKKLRRLAPAIRVGGLEVEFQKTNGRRVITIERADPHRPCTGPADPVPSSSAAEQVRQWARKTNGTRTLRVGRVSKKTHLSPVLTLEDVEE